MNIFRFCKRQINTFGESDTLLFTKLTKTINCFVFDSKGQVENDLFKFNERIEIRLMRKLTKGRSRLNCTAKDQNNNWRWFGHQFYVNKN